MMPNWRNAARLTAWLPASEAVCDIAAAEPCSVSPDLIRMRGLPAWRKRSATAMKRPPSRKPSR
ncbi:hypothetical protein D3C71_1970570 [compost metagenome]